MMINETLANELCANFDPILISIQEFRFVWIVQHYRTPGSGHNET